MNFITLWFWFGLAVTLIILEMIFGAHFFLFWLGALSTLVGIIAWIFPTIEWQYQVLIFSLGSILSIIGWRQYIKRHPIKTFGSSLNRRGEQYLNRTFTLNEPIVNNVGRVKVGDSYWRVEGEDLPAGTEVIVIGVNGATLKVKPAEGVKS